MNTLPLPLWAEILVAALLVTGAAFALLGSRALVKLDDFFKRLHGPSKAGTLGGVGCVLGASVLAFAVAGHGSFHELLVITFLALTAPVSAQLLVKAAKDRPAPAPPPALESSPTNAQTSAQQP